MSLGMVILTVVAALVFFGVLQRVLDRMHLTDRSALFLIALMFAGTLLPNLDFGMVKVSLGGAVIPLGVCIWLWFKADTTNEKIRAVAGAVLTAAAVYLMSKLLPAEAEAMPVDPNLLYGLGAGVIACILGRSRRAAFICGVVGIMLSDAASAAVNWLQGVSQPLVLGGAGVFDAAVISGVAAVLFTELVGEAMERIIRRRNAKRREPV